MPSSSSFAAASSKIYSVNVLNSSQRETSFLIDDVLYHVILWWQFGADCLELFGCEFLQPVRIEAEHSESLIFKSGRLRYSVTGQEIMYMSVAVPVVHIGMERGERN